jgi:hypothetical protein
MANKATKKGTRSSRKPRGAGRSRAKGPGFAAHAVMFSLGVLGGGSSGAAGQAALERATGRRLHPGVDAAASAAGGAAVFGGVPAISKKTRPMAVSGAIGGAVGGGGRALIAWLMNRTKGVGRTPRKALEEQRRREQASNNRLAARPQGAGAARDALEAANFTRN